MTVSEALLCYDLLNDIWIYLEVLISQKSQARLVMQHIQQTEKQVEMMGFHCDLNLFLQPNIEVARNKERLHVAKTMLISEKHNLLRRLFLTLFVYGRYLDGIM